jgi:integrase
MNGYSFKISDKKWQLDKETSVYPYKVVDKMPESLKIGYLNTLAYFSTEYSSCYIKNINSMFKIWVKLMTINTIDDKAVYQLNIHFGPKKNHQLNTVKTFIKKWKKLNYPGVDSTAFRMMDKIKIHTNLAGEAVKRRDPNKGPLTEDEMNTILKSIRKLFLQKKIEGFLYCYITLLAKTGRRPLQLISLKAKDLIKREGDYFLNIPKIKQRKEFRSEFNMKVIDEDLYGNLLMLIDENQSVIEEKFGASIDQMRSELPIFLDVNKISHLNNTSDLSPFIKTDFLHMKKSVISKKLKILTAEYKIISSRTHNYIELNARRFRYTLGTSLANKGASVEVIAKALDHKSIHSSGIYLKNSPDNVRDLDEKLSNFFEPLSKIFLGQEVDESKRLFTEYVLESFGLTNDEKDENRCVTCKNFKPWSA